MTLRVYYNEIDGTAAAWLRELVRAGHLPGGDVDERDIRDVSPVELMGYDQCHFFAGIGGWAYALRLAGWPDDRRVWTGSCPCQPFSAAGRRGGVADERHLWPHWHHLIEVCRPPVVFGEQVASKDGLGWLDLVCADMEGSGYAVGAADLCAAGIGAPHIRQRLWFVGLADAVLAGRAEGRAVARDGSSASGSGDGWLADADGEQRLEGLQPLPGGSAERTGCDQQPHGVGDTDNQGSQEHGGSGDLHLREPNGANQGRQHLNAGVDGGSSRQPRPTDGHWRDADWLFCRDGKWRPVEPASQRMANGLSLCLGSMRRACVVTKEEALSAEDCIGIGRKALRVLRATDGPEAFWLSVGGRLGFPQATFLLAILCEHSRELGVISDSEKTGVAQDGETFLRTMRERASPASCSPQGSECSEQLVRELGDTLSKLSQNSAQHRELMMSLASYTAGPLANKPRARVGRLRGYGNAIVPQVAADFIRSVM